MSMRVSEEFRRWSRWYPAAWRAKNGAAMLGAYLDVAESEGRERLTRAEKAGLVFRGLGARLDAAIPGAVRDLVATVMVSLLGAFGLITGITTEWAPWDPEPRAFGPFVSPFVIVSALAVAVWLFGLAGAERLYRAALVATVVTGLAAGLVVEPYSPVHGWPYVFGLPALFVGLAALLALPAARPRAMWLTVGTLLWVVVFLAPLLPLGHWYLQQTRQGGITSAAMVLESPWSSSPLFTGPSQHVQGGVYASLSIVPVGLLVVVIAMIAALALALAGRRRGGATVVLASIPWAAVLLWSFVDVAVQSPLMTDLAVPDRSAYGFEALLDRLSMAINMAILLVPYVVAIALAVRYRRSSRIAEPIDGDLTPVGG